MLCLIPAVAALALGHGQTGSEDLSRLVPILASSGAFNPEQGQALRLASFVPPAESLGFLVASGVDLFVSETDKLTAPDSGAGIYDLSNLAAQRAAIAQAGGGWAVSVFSTFLPFENGLAVGNGSIDVSTGERVPAWSPWNPERVRWTANRYGAMNRRFPKPGFVSLGVYGEYGDASMFTGLAKLSETYAVRWKEQLKVDPPASGYWCGDDFAKASWQKNLVAEHGSVESAYKNWGMEPVDPKQAPIPLGPTYPYPARLQFMDWYRAAIPALVRSLGDIGRNIFKESPIVVPIGPPDDHPGLGLDIYRVAEAVKVNADAMLVSNVGYFDFANNWAMSLGRIRGAARAQTLPIWTQASTLKTGDFGQQFFEALSLGSHGYVGWPTLYRANAAELDALAANLLVGSPAVDVAVMHPTSSHLLAHPQPAPPLTYRAMVELRDYADFDVLEESAVIAGALKPYRVAIVFEGTVWKAETLQELSEWVEAGGVVVAYDFGKMADPQGNTAVYQRLFGFASGLHVAADTSRWVGELPASYTIDLGTKWDTEYLLGGWGPAAEGVRLAKNGAVLRVPVSREKNSILTISFRNFRWEGQTLEVRSQGKVLAGVSAEGGLQQFRFSADKDLAPNGVLALEMSGLSADTHVPIDRITVAESDTQAEPVPLKGRFEAPVEIDAAKAWSNRHGKGLILFLPAKRDAWKQFISLARHAIYRLSLIQEGRADAKLFDDRNDGVFMANLGRRIAILNESGAEVERRSQTIPNGAIRVVSLDSPSFTKTYQLEDLPIDNLSAVQAPEASPGKGTTALRVSPGQVLPFTIAVEDAGRHKIFARTLRNGQLAPVRFKVGEIDAAPQAGKRAAYLVGEFALPKGATTIEMSSDEPFLADLVIVTNHPSIAGYRFAVNPN